MKKHFMHRKCRTCGQLKEITAFTKSKRSRYGRAFTCKQCRADQERIRKYGITKEEYAEWMKRDRCDICGIHSTQHNGKGRLHLDHDHATGIVRGVLCNSCNAVLGHANDSLEILSRCADYLNRHMTKEALFEPGGDAMENSDHD